MADPEILRHGTFDASELELVPDPTAPVILKSGGPIMNVIEETEGGILCEWDDGLAHFHPDMLYRCVPYRGAKPDAEEA